jgi:predicted ribosomally synthesized peptide with nif11-like leader
MLASEPLQQFLAHVGRDPRLQVRVQEAVTAAEVALLAQELGYAVSGSDLLRLDGQIPGGVRITRWNHPGEYPGRYV